MIFARPAVAVALALSAAALVLPVSRAARYDTLTGATQAGTPVAVALRDGRLGRLTAGPVTVRCADGLAVESPAVSAGFDGRVATGERATRYPDGSPGSLARVSATATARGRAVTGTIRYALTLYGPLDRVNRCSAGPLRFVAG